MRETTPLSRRDWIATILRTLSGAAALTAIAVLRPEVAVAAGARSIVIYKDPNCDCCKRWVTHLRTHGFAPDARDRADMDALKDSLGVPTALRSCHTAVVGRYLIEGHVPAADITRLLATTPRGVAGLAVPGMPMGSLGMEMPGGRAERYDVLAFHVTGATTVFASRGRAA